MSECPSVRIGLHVAACGPIGTNFGTHMQIHLDMESGLNINYPV